MTRAQIAVVGLGLLAALALAAAGCDQENLCGEAPLCRNGQAINCDPTCSVAPCSNSPRFQDCPEDTTCHLAYGDPGSTRFFRTRAVCQVNGSASCDPIASAPATCDGVGNVQGCSAYGEVIVVACAQAPTFFDEAPACCSEPFDAGTDAGTDGGTDGGADAGTDGGTNAGSDAGP